LGILIYELILGDNPFYEDGIDHTVLYDIICNNPPYYDPADTISPAAKSLIDRLLEKEPSKRLGSFREKDILEDPWLSKYHLMDLRAKRVKAPWVPDPVLTEG
jgi:serum/glucocorticoid-regulated kinase 2